jgi:hypothetical protein
LVAVAAAVVVDEPYLNDEETDDEDEERGLVGEMLRWWEGWGGSGQSRIRL